MILLTVETLDIISVPDINNIQYGIKMKIQYRYLIVYSYILSFTAFIIDYISLICLFICIFKNYTSITFTATEIVDKIGIKWINFNIIYENIFINHTTSYDSCYYEIIRVSNANKTAVDGK